MVPLRHLIPKLRKGSFFPVILDLRRRIDHALSAVVIEAYVSGVSSRSVYYLVAALKRSFQGAAHRRCRVHFARNLLALVPKTHTDMVAAVFRTIFAQPDATTLAAT